MLIKSLSFFTIFLTMASTNAETAKRNLCDDLVASGKSTEEQIKKCIAKYGESDFYKEELQKKKWQEDAAKAAKDKEVKVSNNIEMKEFTELELTEAAFGKSFFAFNIDYKNPNFPKQERITDGDALCKYLGYTKAIKSTVSEELKEEETDKNGLVIGSSLFGLVDDKDPTLWSENTGRYRVRKYKDITCARLKDKSIEGSAEALKSIKELLVVNDELNKPKVGNGADRVNDGPRNPASPKAPNAYQRPDWVDDAPKGKAK